jgi:dTDP-4-dehydrorhamnose reductase
LIDAATAEGVEAAGVRRADVDITDAEAVRRAIEFNAPAVVINAAAYTAVDRAEDEPDLAFAVNSDGPANIAAACAGAGVPLVHISTDYVFDGTKHGPYAEADAPNPAGVYGASKLAGENRVRAALPGRHIILRTAWVFSSRGHNFVRTIWRLSRERPTLRIVADQVGSPTPADDLADALLVTARVLAANDGAAGVYHWAGGPAVSWHGLAEAVVAEARVYSTVATHTIEAISTDQYPVAASRPANAVLDTALAERTFALQQPDWRAGVRRAVGLLEASERR